MSLRSLAAAYDTDNPHCAQCATCAYPRFESHASVCMCSHIRMLAIRASSFACPAVHRWTYTYLGVHMPQQQSKMMIKGDMQKEKDEGHDAQ